MENKPCFKRVRNACSENIFSKYFRQIRGVCVAKITCRCTVNRNKNDVFNYPERKKI